MPEIEPLALPNPGTVIPSGSLFTPSGSIGPAGLNAFSTSTASFTVPAIGATANLTVSDASSFLVGELVYLDQAGGGVGLPGILQITAKAGNTLTLLNPTPPPAQPNASTTAAGLLAQISGNTTDYIRADNTSQNLATAIQPTIWSARLRSYNAIGNPTFEVTQRNCGASLNTPGNVFQEDRWNWYVSGSGQNYTAQIVTPTFPSDLVKLPGTNYVISNKFLRLTNVASTASTSIIANLYQIIEGPVFRELIGDTHSITILARSNLAGLSFGIALRDSYLFSGGTVSALTELCTIPTANTWVLITFPAIPAFTLPGSTSLSPGTTGYYFHISIQAASGYIAPANNTWYASNQYVAAPGQANFFAQPNGTTLDIAFVQHEPGAVCTTPMDLDFATNIWRCQRYYQKSYPYGTIAGTATYSGSVGATTNSANTTLIMCSTTLRPLLARNPPTPTVYSESGAINNVRDVGSSVDRAVTSANTYMTDGGIMQLSLTAAGVANNPIRFHYVADTGW